MLCAINSQVLNLKLPLCVEKQKRKIMLRGKLNKCAYSLGVKLTRKYFGGGYSDFGYT
jgi:hypothetical protein